MAQIPLIDLKKENKFTDKLESLVTHMINLQKESLNSKTMHEKTAFVRQTDITNKQIDQPVYRLYGLTDEEIRIVDGNTSSVTSRP